MHPELLRADAALDAVAEIRRACHDGDGTDPLDEAAALRLRHHGLEGLEAAVCASGFALRDGDRLDLAVAPATRGGGLGAWLAAKVLERPGEVTAWSHTDHPGARRLAERFSFTAVRDLWVMRRPSSTPLPSTGPAAIQVRAFDPDDPRDRAEVLRVNAAAFADHPEQGDLDAAGLAERMAQPWFDPKGLLLAVDDDRLLGFHWTKVHDEGHGEVYVLGIDPAAQGRGVGRVLTTAGLEHLAAQGVGEVILFVESDNGPAVRLYQGLGFVHAPGGTHVQYRRGLDQRHARTATNR